tara:strand:+ start:174 stop:578 length:405 start_codon:yes stop_codon:yes gene_type:complete
VSAYETVTAAHLRVGDVFKGADGGQIKVASLHEMLGTSTVKVRYTDNIGPMMMTYGITHPFERLIVPTTERLNVHVLDLRVGDVIAEGPWGGKAVVSVSPLRMQGAVSVRFERTGLATTFGVHFIMAVERGVKS